MKINFCIFSLIFLLLFVGCTGNTNIPNNEEKTIIDSSFRIRIANKKFYVDGKKIWINGANTPWNNWNDFGGIYDDAWWDVHFSQLHEAGVNATRVWINCNNDQGAVTIADNGMVSGASTLYNGDSFIF